MFRTFRVYERIRLCEQTGKMSVHEKTSGPIQVKRLDQKHRPALGPIILVENLFFLLSDFQNRISQPFA